MLKIAVLISGGGTNLQALIDAIKQKKINAKIDAVISNRKDAYGLIRAKNENIDALCFSKKDFPDSEQYDARIITELKKRNIDLVVLAGYLNILTKKFIAEYGGKIINIHPSLIPAFCGSGYYGIHVHKAVINKGVKFTGATTHFVDENIDTGAIIMQDIVPVLHMDDAESIAKKVLKIEHCILVKTVKAFCERRIIVKNNKAVIVEANERGGRY